MKLPNFTCYGGLKQATTKFYFSFSTWRGILGIDLDTIFEAVGKSRQTVRNYSVCMGS